MVQGNSKEGKGINLRHTGTGTAMNHSKKEGWERTVEPGAQMLSDPSRYRAMLFRPGDAKTAGAGAGETMAGEVECDRLIGRSSAASSSSSSGSTLRFLFLSTQSGHSEQ